MRKFHRILTALACLFFIGTSLAKKGNQYPLIQQGMIDQIGGEQNTVFETTHLQHET